MSSLRRGRAVLRRVVPGGRLDVDDGVAASGGAGRVLEEGELRKSGLSSLVSSLVRRMETYLFP